MEGGLKEFKKHLKIEKFKNKYNKSLHQSVNLNSLISSHPKKSKNKFQKIKVINKKNSKIKNQHNQSYEGNLSYDLLLTDDSFCNNTSTIIPNSNINKKSNDDLNTKNNIYYISKKSEEFKKEKLEKKFNLLDNSNNKNLKKNLSKQTNKIKLNNSTITNPFYHNQIKEKNKSTKLGNIINNFETISYNTNNDLFKDKKKKIKTSSLPHSTYNSKKNSKIRTKIVDTKNILLNNINNQMSNNSTNYSKKNEENSFISNNNLELKEEDNFFKEKTFFNSFLDNYIQNIDYDKYYDYKNYKQLKNDFFLLYTDNYLQNIQEDLIKLEFELIIEKMFELIVSYHSQLRLIKSSNIFNKKIYNECENEYYMLEKKLMKLLLLKEKRLNTEKNFNIISNNFFKEKSLKLKINLNQFQIIKNILPQNVIHKKEKLKEIVIKVLENKNNDSLINDNKLRNWIKINKIKKEKINVPKINIGSINVSGNNISIKTSKEKKSKIGKNTSNKICKTQRMKNIKNKL